MEFVYIIHAICKLYVLQSFFNALESYLWLFGIAGSAINYDEVNKSENLFLVLCTSYFKIGVKLHNNEREFSILLEFFSMNLNL